MVSTLKAGKSRKSSKRRPSNKHKPLRLFVAGKEVTVLPCPIEVRTSSRKLLAQFFVGEYDAVVSIQRGENPVKLGRLAEKRCISS